MDKEFTQEELNSMTPDQIAELQKQNCLFCKIVKGEIPSKKVYQDEICIGILDINPASEGHILLMPKEHFQILPQIPEKIQSHIFIVAKELSHTLLKEFGAKGTNIFVANGAAAGQKAPHFMVHVFPRAEKDEIFQNKLIPLSQSDIQALKKHLLPKIYDAFNIVPVQESQADSLISDDDIDKKLVKDLNKDLDTEDDEVYDSDPFNLEHNSTKTPPSKTDTSNTKKNSNKDEDDSNADDADVQTNEKSDQENDEETDDSTSDDTNDDPSDDTDAKENTENKAHHDDDLEIPLPPDDDDPFEKLQPDTDDSDESDLDKISKLFT